MPITPLPRYASLDGLVVVVLSAIAMSGLRDSFSGWEWVAVAALGMAVGLGWAFGLALFRLGPSMVVLTLFIPYVLTAGALALGKWGKWGVPEAETLGDVVQGTWRAWGQLVHTLPPLDSEGTVMLVPYVLAMAAGGLAGSLAVGSPRPTLPAVPLIVVLALTLVLGTAEPFSVLVQGVVFGAVALGWVGHRSARTATSLGSLRGLRGRLPLGPRRRVWTPLSESEKRLTAVSGTRTIAATLCVGLAAALVLPWASSVPERPRWVLREALPALDTSKVTTPLTTFRSFRPAHAPDVASSVLFRVDGVPTGTLLRIAVLDGYDGTSWYAVPDRPDVFDDRFVGISSQIANPARGKAAQALIEVEHPWLLDWLPVVGHPQSIEFLRDPEHKLRNSVRFNRSTDSALTTASLAVGDSYLVSTVLPTDELKPAMKHYRVPDWEMYDAAGFLDGAVNVMSDRRKEPILRLFQLADWLYVAGRYSDGGAGWESRFTKGHNVARLGKGFVEAPQIVGNDEQYAATMALLAARMTVPARVVVGAAVNGRGEVRGRDIHAWVEVRVKDGSWRRMPTETFMSDTPPDPVDPPKPTWPKKWEHEIRPETPEEAKRRERAEREAEEEAEERRRAEEQPVPWWALGFVPLAFIVGIPGAKYARSRRRSGHVEANVRALAGWAEVVDSATDLGLAVPRRPRPDQARALGVPIDLAQQADLASFTDQTPQVGAGYWDRIDEARRTLRTAAPRWRRVVALISPRSLWRRGPR